MSIFTDFMGLFFPRTCEACDGAMVKKEEIICSNCLHNLPRTNSHRYNLDALNSKFYGKQQVKDTWCFLYFKKDSPVQRLLHRLKYENKPEIGNFIGRLFGTELKKDLKEISFDSIIPVPLHKTRQKRRGYNQSEHFALGLGEILDLPVDTDSVKRIKRSQTQTKKSRIERWENVAEIFEVQDVSKVKNRSILVVDDVMTTGSTLEACMEKLMQSGAREITVATIAVAV
ncbi:MAG: ComF family protein [Candidatus Cyclobacteriaceae bacterium M2_1C_046]